MKTETGPTPPPRRNPDSPRIRRALFRQLLGLFPPGSLIDLAAGHGHFARIAADMGWQVTAQDVRPGRFPNDDRITWQTGDLRDVDFTGFDVVSCLGVFYHLTLADQLSLLDKTSGTPLIIDTHVANDRFWPRLSEPVVVDGYRGRLFQEPADFASFSAASWGNASSFWPRPKAFYRMLNERGYDVLTSTPWYMPTRTFYLCLPRQAAAGEVVTSPTR